MRGTVHSVNGVVLSEYKPRLSHYQCSANSRLINSAGFCSASAGRIVSSVAVYSISAQSAAPPMTFFPGALSGGLDYLFCHKRGGNEY